MLASVVEDLRNSAVRDNIFFGCLLLSLVLKVGCLVMYVERGIYGNWLLSKIRVRNEIKIKKNKNKQ